MNIVATQYASDLVAAYGWGVARDLAEAEARPHSPTGNRDRFWSLVLAAIEQHLAGRCVGCGQ